MEQDNLHTEKLSLISKYLSDNASSAEIAELEAWVLADPVHKEQFLAYKKAWILSGMQKSQGEIPVDKLWEETHAQLSESAPAKVLTMTPKKNRFAWVGWAAAVLVLLIASFWFFQNQNSSGALLVESKNEVKNLNLADGSAVTLNQASSLAFTPASEEEVQRKVKLEGDAFFDVARDEVHPFVIQASSVEIEVLGTSFYVDAREDAEEIHVIVASGKVAVRSMGQEQILEANQKAIFSKAKEELRKAENDDENFRSLQTQTLVFSETGLEEVVFALNRQYNVNIRLGNEGLKACKLNATYKQKSLPAILQILEESLGIEVEKRGTEIVFDGSCSVN